MKTEIFEVLKLNRVAESMELELIEIFNEQGYARNSIEMVSYWENKNRLLLDGRSGLRLKLILRPGLEKIAAEILDQGTKLTNKRKELLLEELL